MQIACTLKDMEVQIKWNYSLSKRCWQLRVLCQTEVQQEVDSTLQQSNWEKINDKQGAEFKEIGKNTDNLKQEKWGDRAEMESQGSVSRTPKVVTLAVRFRGDWWLTVEVRNQSYPAAQQENWGDRYPILSSSVFRSPTETPIVCAQTAETKEAYTFTDVTEKEKKIVTVGSILQKCYCPRYSQGTEDLHSKKESR